jgi:ribosomal protein S18 acetylase RimI-like enzyme
VRPARDRRSADLVIATATSLDAETTEQIRQIYSTSFPASERLDFDELLRSCQSPERTLFVAASGLSAIGFAVVLDLPDVRSQLLEYIAIAPAVRNRGIGTALLRAVTVVRRQPANRGLFIEVEPVVGTSAERRLRQRRIAWYQRNRAQLVAGVTRYQIPDLASDGRRRLELQLFWLPVRSAAVPRGSALKAGLRSLYRHSYELAADDPLVLDVLASVTEDRSPAGER